jgi:hypothetical protein
MTDNARMIPSARIERTSRGLVHCIALCRDCAWSDDDYIDAARAATRHVRQTGHTVEVEQGIVYSVRVKP